MRPSEHADTSLPLPAPTATPTAHAPAGHGLTSLDLACVPPRALRPFCASPGGTPFGVAAWLPTPPPSPPPIPLAPDSSATAVASVDEEARVHLCDRLTRRRSQSLGPVPSAAVARIRPPAARDTEVRRRAGGDGEAEKDDPRRKRKIGPRARRPLAWRRQPEMLPHGVARTLNVGEGGRRCTASGIVRRTNESQRKRDVCVFRVSQDVSPTWSVLLHKEKQEHKVRLRWRGREMHPRCLDIVHSNTNLKPDTKTGGRRAGLTPEDDCNKQQVFLHGFSHQKRCLQVSAHVPPPPGRGCVYRSICGSAAVPLDVPHGSEGRGLKHRPAAVDAVENCMGFVVVVVAAVVIWASTTAAAAATTAAAWTFHPCKGDGRDVCHCALTRARVHAGRGGRRVLHVNVTQKKKHARAVWFHAAPVQCARTPVTLSKMRKKELDTREARAKDPSRVILAAGNTASSWAEAR